MQKGLYNDEIINLILYEMNSKNKMKKLLLLGILLFGFTASGWSQKVSLNFKNEKVEKVLSSIKNQTGMALVFSDQVVDVNRLVSIQVKDCSLGKLWKNCWLAQRWLMK